MNKLPKSVAVLSTRLVSLVLILSLIAISTLALPRIAIAQGECTEADLRDKGVSIMNCAGDNYCSVSASIGSAAGTRISQGSKLYVLGDSITVGMRDSGDLASKLTAVGVEPIKINAVGGKDLNWGRQQLEADKATLDTATAVLIGLGTNNVGNVVTNGKDGPSRAIDGAQQTLERMMQGIVDAVQSGSETKKQLFWTTVFIKGTLSTGYGDFNMDIAMPIINAAIKNVATTNGITIVPWDTSAEAPVWTAEDGIHPSGHYPEMASFVVSNLTSPGSQSTPTPSTSGCVCATPSLGSGGSRDERYRTTWGYFTSTKGLSAEATAGVMGNLEAESGIDPHNVQNSAPVPDAPEIPIDAIRGSYGYGIAQWTSAGRQENLIQYAAETNRSTGDLGLQLDFLWKELTEDYAGVTVVLQTPNVSVSEASYTFLSEFEIPAPFTDSGTQEQRDEETLNRLAKAQAIFNEFSGQSIPGSTGGGCTANGTTIDLESSDTSSIPCGPGTTDAGVADGYREGRIIKIRLCSVGGTRVNSQLASSFGQMLTDSNAAGVPLGVDGGGGSFRTMEQQIERYYSWCARAGIEPTPEPYPKENWSDYTRCPGAAPPGYSNHQAGLGVDLTCDGVLIPQSYEDASTNPCFSWLVANASKYSLFEYGKGQSRSEVGYEGWHWSVDGG